MPLERWVHITFSHPEIDDNEFGKVLEIVNNPNFILKGDHGELFAITKELGSRYYFVVIYKEQLESDGFIITAYKTTDAKWLFKRKILWKKT